MVIWISFFLFSPTQAGNTQKTIQMLLVIVAVLCVPWMLLVRPLILRKRMKEKHHQYQIQTNDDEDMLDGGADDGGHGHHEASFGRSGDIRG